MIFKSVCNKKYVAKNNNKFDVGYVSQENAPWNLQASDITYCNIAVDTLLTIGDKYVHSVGSRKVTKNITI